MAEGPLAFVVRSETFDLHRLPPGARPDPAWFAAGWVSVTGTGREWSIVAPATVRIPGSRCEPGWSCLQVDGVLEFSLVGILAHIAGVLAEAGVSLFALSTFDTDHVFVKTAQLPVAVAALRAAGHRVATAPADPPSSPATTAP